MFNLQKKAALSDNPEDKKMNTNKKFRIIVLIVFTVIFLPLGLILTWNTTNLYLYGISTTGQYERTLGGVTRDATSEYSFQDTTGQTHIASDRGSMAPQIQIIYDPTNPERNIIATPLNLLMGPFALAIFVFFALIPFIRLKRK